MTVDKNTVTSADLVAQSIDFVEQFSDNVSTLLKAMGNVRMHPMANGTLIQTYKTDTTNASSRTVAEGEVIPLTKISRTKNKQYELTLTDKLRKTTTFEAIQKDGYDQAVTYTDSKLLAIAQKNAKTDLFGALTSKGTTTASGVGLQPAISAGLGKLAGLFEDIDGVGTTIAYVNPDDLYKYLGNAQITVQTTFGLKYLQNYLNVDAVFLTTAIPAGKVVMTVSDNMNFYYVDMRGEAGRAFEMQVDQTGLIGVTHKQTPEALSYDTIAAGGWLLLPERTDGIVTSTITTAPSTGLGH
ncbi:hypothetical protein [Lactobacillus helveticus]|uniref:hypothetical protein n=1 Tax=Lactobacillus helveticus TaxID=1587 RepID=UPI001561C325|nr:hypothetical protein [Lactobacillus helveticus]NRN88423.1 hypothetical protein [Lactobacillus helveticus]NRN92680.1 hypothetical protein [Lactobacillus helveticus]NRO57408.1 hypothetical protein [Lactobacillus helveticus]